jgi:hypothetical protein
VYHCQVHQWFHPTNPCPSCWSSTTAPGASTYTAYQNTYTQPTGYGAAPLRQPSPEAYIPSSAATQTGRVPIAVSCHGVLIRPPERFTVPANVTLVFYAKPGEGVSNPDGFAIQNALQRRVAVPVQEKARAVGGSSCQNVFLRGDYRSFKSGIVSTDMPLGLNVLMKIERTDDLRLDGICAFLSSTFPRASLEIHCVFCLE